MGGGVGTAGVILTAGPIVALILSAIALAKLPGMQDEKYNFSEWLVLNSIEIAVASVSLIIIAVGIVVLFFLDNIGRTGAILFTSIFLINGLEIVPVVVFMIKGAVRNDFANNYMLKTVEYIEKKNRCCFGLNGYARPECSCKGYIDNETNIYEDPGYDISYLYDTNNTLKRTFNIENDDVQAQPSPKTRSKRKRTCGECKYNFYYNQWMYMGFTLAANIASSVIYGGLCLIFIWGAMTESKTPKPTQQEPYEPEVSMKVVEKGNKGNDDNHKNGVEETTTPADEAANIVAPAPANETVEVSVPVNEAVEVVAPANETIEANVPVNEAEVNIEVVSENKGDEQPSNTTL